MRLSEKISNDTLSTSILRELNEADESIKEYRYITNHGLGPGTIPEDIKLIRWEDLDNGKTAIYLNRPLSDEELNKYDIKPEWIQETDKLTERHNKIVGGNTMRLSEKIATNGVVINESEEKEMLTCPECGKKFPKGLEAISRKDNKTPICSECGQKEALKAYFGESEQPKEALTESDATPEFLEDLKNMINNHCRVGGVITDMSLTDENGDEYVVITFDKGATKKVNITGDSNISAMRDILFELA